MSMKRDMVQLISYRQWYTVRLMHGADADGVAHDEDYGIHAPSPVAAMIMALSHFSDLQRGPIESAMIIASGKRRDASIGCLGVIAPKEAKR